MEFVQYIPDNPTTPISDENPWWGAIREASDSLKQPLEVEIFPAATDSRFVRLQGIPAIGVSPINHTKVLLHDHDEFLNENVYLRGISWYEEVITKLSQVSEADELKSPKLKLTKQ
jgi:aminoacylase